MNKYLSQKATPWVSVAVLAGGMLTAILLVVLVRIENGVQDLSNRLEVIEEAIERGTY